MKEVKAKRVWVQSGTGQEWAVGASCSIGRAEKNDVIIDDDKVSRRHALIHRQDDRGYWIIDLGSGNGTYLNGKRVIMPTPLRNEDRITIASQNLTFFQDVELIDEAGHSTSSMTNPMETVIDIRERKAWLMVGDLVGSSKLSAQLPPEDAARFVGRWLSDSGTIIEGCEGSINKYLGDGFLAYWPHDKTAAGNVLKALQKFERLRANGKSPNFRIVVHHGRITSGGHGSLGEESLMGLDVNYVFRMEKLAAGLKTDLLFSGAARDVMGDLLAFDSVGRHALEGFDHPEPHEFFKVG